MRSRNQYGKRHDDKPQQPTRSTRFPSAAAEGKAAEQEWAKNPVAQRANIQEMGTSAYATKNRPHLPGNRERRELMARERAGRFQGEQSWHVGGDLHPAAQREQAEIQRDARRDESLSQLRDVHEKRRRRF